MNTFLEKILVLQDRDLRLMRLSAESVRIPEELKELSRQEKTARDAVEQVKTEMKRIDLDRKKLEMEVSTKEELARKYKGQLLEIKNNDQFHALQNEITHIESEVHKIEDSELQLMEKTESLQSTLKELEIQLKEALQKIEIQRKDLGEKSVQIEKQDLQLKEERNHLSADIDETILSRYERIFKSKNGHAVVRISHGMCMGCHLKLTAQEIHHAQDGSELVTCTNCGRILYWMAE